MKSCKPISIVLLVVFMQNFLLGIANAQDSESDSEEEIEEVEVSSVKALGRAAKNALVNPLLFLPFFRGNLYHDIPHLFAPNPLGHRHFNSEVEKKLIAIAKTNPYGIATMWIGPFAFIYVLENKTRLLLINQSQVGIINRSSYVRLYGDFGGNNVMATFPNFRPLNSSAYQSQRKYLQSRFFAQAHKRLPLIDQTIKNFLHNYQVLHGECSIHLRDFVTALVLHVSSHLIGLSEVPMDTYYFSKPDYRETLRRVAHYGVSERVNPSLEKKLYDIFLQIFHDNFEQIKRESADDNLIKNIFDSLAVDFPETTDDFEKISYQTRYEIAMNFVATGLGAMVHSTANSLDWVLSLLYLPTNYAKLIELKQLINQNHDVDFANPENFCKGKILFPISQWVMRNIFLYPTFYNQLFFHSMDRSINLPGRDEPLTIAQNTYIIVSHGECNRGQGELKTPSASCNIIDESPSFISFAINTNNAAFGGGQSKHKNRRCPGAITALLEIAVAMGRILQYDVNISDICEQMDKEMHPLCSRVNQGTIRFRDF